jgi:hypothetical protein
MILLNHLSHKEYQFFQSCLSTIYRFPGNVEQLFGSLFEDVFAEMKNGIRQNGGSSNAVDIISQDGVRYSLKTLSLNTNLGIDKLVGQKEILIPITTLAKDRVVDNQNIENIIIPYYNTLSNLIDKQSFLIRVIPAKEEFSELKFIYWEQEFEKIQDLEIIRNNNVKGCHSFKSDINLISIPKKITWNSASQRLRVYYKIPENSDIITINRSEKLNWNSFIEKINQ